MSDAYAELWEFNHAGSTITVVVAGTFYKWITSSVGQAGPSDLAVPDAVFDTITIGANGAGIYGVMVSASFGGSVNALMEMAVFVNGVVQTNLEVSRKLSAAGDEGASGISGMLALSSGDVVDLRFTSDSNGDTVDLYHVNLSIFSIIRTP